MPYIEPNDRTDPTDAFSDVTITRKQLGEGIGRAMRNGGDLQYMLAVAIQTYLKKTGLCYQNCQDIMGALTGANAEFIRCIVSLYEKKKIADNGAVYDLEALENDGY